MSDQLYRINWEQAKLSDMHSEHSWAQVHTKDLIHGGVLVPMERCEHGNTKQHLVDYWWQNNSNAGASWCDGIPDGERIENLDESGRYWVDELQGLGVLIKTGPKWNDSYWVLEGENDE